MKASFVVCASVLFGVVACNRAASPTSPTTTTSSGVVVPSADAVERLTNARCDREMACNHIGQNQRFTDREACRREMRHNSQADLRAESCPRGVDETRLSSCLSEIQNERCGNVLDKVDRLATCRTSELCIR